MQPEQNMNQASQWRLVMVAGSTSRGWADSYFDIEIGVFWTALEQWQLMQQKRASDSDARIAHVGFPPYRM